MGLFGYNEKTYAKNSEAIKTRVQDLMERAAYAKIPGAGIALNTALLYMTDYPVGADKKQLEGIDTRIFKLLETLMNDLQQKKNGGFSAHANMLMTAIASSRFYGKEAFAPEQLHAQETMANCNAEIEEKLFQKERIVKEMAEIVEKGKRITAENPNSVALQRLQLQYKTLDTEKKNTEQGLQLWVTQYNNAVAQFNVMQDIKTYKEITAAEVQTPAQFAKMAEDAARQLSQVVSRQHEVIDIADEYGKTKDEAIGGVAVADDAGFSELIADTGDVSKDIAGANAPAGQATVKTDNAADFFSKL